MYFQTFVFHGTFTDIFKYLASPQGVKIGPMSIEMW